MKKSASDSVSYHRVYPEKNSGAESGRHVQTEAHVVGLFLSYKSEIGKSFNWRTYLTEVDEIRRKNSSENVSNGRESNTDPTIQEGKGPSGPSVVIYAAERLLDEWSLSTIRTDGGCSQVVISANAKEKDCPEDPLSPAMAAPKLETVSTKKEKTESSWLTAQVPEPSRCYSRA